MKTFTRLIEEVVFEAGANKLNDLETVAGLIIEEVLDKYTGQFRYAELFVPDVELTLTTLATGLFTLPSDYQHIDWNSLVFYPLGEIEDGYTLSALRSPRNVNEGPVKYYTRNSTQIFVYPFDELDGTDILHVDYWRKSNAKTNNLIVPDSLVQTVKDESISRLALTLGSKTAAPYMTMARESHAMSLGSVDLPPQQ